MPFPQSAERQGIGRTLCGRIYLLVSLVDLLAHVANPKTLVVIVNVVHPALINSARAPHPADRILTGPDMSRLVLSFGSD